MPSLKIAGADVSAIQVGSTDVQAVYIGETEIWSSAPDYVMTQSVHYYTTNDGVRGPDGVQHTIAHRKYGYSTGYGSISPTSFTFSSYSGSTPHISEFYQKVEDPSRSGVATTYYTILIIDGLVSNDGWTSVDTGYTTLDRTAASWFQLGGKTNWLWNISTSTFGSSGQTDVNFT